MRLGIVVVLLLALAWTPASASTTTLRLLVLYDTTGTEWVAANGGMTVFAQEAVDKMNATFTNSGIDLEVELVHTASVPYTYPGGGLSDALNAIRDTAIVGAQVQAMRNQHQAHLVSILVDTGSAFGFTGVANLMTSPDGLSERAHSANSIRSVDIGNVLTHELGHNLGAHHAKTQDQSPGPNSPLGEYSAGWYFTGADDEVKYHTIMAYNQRTTGDFYTASNIFSSPLLTHQGTAAGDADDGDNARVLEETREVASGYRRADFPPPVVLPATDRTSSGFRANWEAVAGATGYQLFVSPNGRFSSYSFWTLGNVTDFALTGRAAGTTYYYRVQALGADGIQSGHSTTAIVSTTGADEHLVTIDKVGTGGGVVSSNVGGVDCGATCAIGIDEGTEITLTATPNASSDFVAWGGSCDGTSPTCVVTVNHALTAVAWFDGESDPPPDPVVLENGVSLNDLAAGADAETHYYIDVPAGAELTVTLSGGSGDADLYVRFGAQPTLSTFDCRPWTVGNEEECVLQEDDAGRYYIMLHAFEAYLGASLTASYAGGAPAVVSGLTVQSTGDGSVYLSWDEPDDGASPITDYTIQYSSDGGSNWTTFDDGVSSATSVTVTGLTIGAVYLFRVIAVNAEGPGPAPDDPVEVEVEDVACCGSALSGWRLAVFGGGPPGRISDLQVEAGFHEATLSWSAPATGGSPITDYVIEYSSDGGSTWTVFPDGVSTATMATLTGLDGNTDYLFRVSAVNSVGTGPAPTQPVAATVDEVPRPGIWRYAIPDPNDP